MVIHDYYVTDDNQEYINELRMAMQICDQALGHLYRANDDLVQASRLNGYDYYGEEVLMSMARRNHIMRAKQEIDATRQALYYLRTELSDFDLDDQMLVAEYFPEMGQYVLQVHINDYLEEIHDLIGKIQIMKKRINNELNNQVYYW